MSVEKLAYQYGWDLAAAERGYSSFRAYEKHAGWFGNQARAGALAAATLAGHAHVPAPIASAPLAHAVTGQASHAATSMEKLPQLGDVYKQTKLHPADPVGAMRAAAEERFQAVNEWRIRRGEPLSHREARQVRRDSTNEANHLSIRPTDAYQIPGTERFVPIRKQFNLPDDHRLLNLPRGQRQDGMRFTGDPAHLGMGPDGQQFPW